VRFGQLCKFTTGGTPSRRKPENFVGKIPWVKIGDMLQGVISDTEEHISNDALQSSSSKLLPAGTLLLSIFATVGRTAVLAVPAATNQAIVGITPLDDSKIDMGYLRHYLDSAVATLVSRARGVAQVNINLGVLRELPIPLPPLPEQRQIASILDHADLLRGHRRSSIATLDELSESALRDFMAKGAKLGWASVSLGEVAGLQGGLQVSKARNALPLTVPYLRVANVYRSHLDLAEVKMIQVTVAEADRARLVEGDILMVEGHGNPREVGRASRWTGSVSNMVHQNHLIRARAHENILDSRYLEAVLNSSVVRSHWSRVAKTTSGLNTINMTNVRAVPVLLPPIDGQREFVSQIVDINNLRKVQLEHQAKLDELFASLQYSAMADRL